LASKANGTTTVEPDFLAARRERAVGLRETLGLPQFKGRPGWEFTDISSLDLGSYVAAPAPHNGDGGPGRPASMFEPDAAAELRQVDGGEPTLTGELPAGVIVSSLEQAAREHPELVERHLGSVIDGEDVFVARNEAGFRGGAFVYVPRETALERPILLTAVQDQPGTELHRRTLIVLESGAQAEVWEQAISSAPDNDGVFNTVVELVIGENSSLRFVSGQDLSERSWIFGMHRAEIARDAALDWVALGFGSAGGHVRMETRLGGPGADVRARRGRRAASARRWRGRAERRSARGRDRQLSGKRRPGAPRARGASPRFGDRR